MKSGQILIIVLLIVVVTLAVGLSVASRNITNLRTSTQTEQSQRAFSAAEGGVEDVLNQLSTLKLDTATVNTAAGRDIPVTGLSGDITTIVNLKGVPSFEASVGTGEIIQTGLVQADVTGYNGTFDIEWSKRNTEEDTPAASIEVTLVCADTTGICNDTRTWQSNYGQKRYYFRVGTRTEEASFPPGVTSPANPTGTVCMSGGAYACKATIPPSGTLGTNVLFARIRPLWKDATIKVTGSGAQALNFPIQTYEISSRATMTSSGISRRVQVKRTALPTLPAAFDFAVYSEQSITK